MKLWNTSNRTPKTGGSLAPWFPVSTARDFVESLPRRSSEKGCSEANLDTLSHLCGRVRTRVGRKSMTLQLRIELSKSFVIMPLISGLKNEVKGSNQVRPREVHHPLCTLKTNTLCSPYNPSSDSLTHICTT